MPKIKNVGSPHAVSWSQEPLNKPRLLTKEKCGSTTAIFSCHHCQLKLADDQSHKFGQIMNTNKYSNFMVVWVFKLKYSYTLEWVIFIMDIYWPEKVKLLPAAKFDEESLIDMCCSFLALQYMNFICLTSLFPFKVAVNVSRGEQTFPQIMADFSLCVH